MVAAFPSYPRLKGFHLHHKSDYLLGPISEKFF